MILRQLLAKNKAILLYVVFGVLTTLVNIIVYGVCYSFLSIANVASNTIAWIFSVFFAFMTNKFYVFGSKSIQLSTFVRELGMFVGARLFTGLLDLGIMYV